MSRFGNLSPKFGPTRSGLGRTLANLANSGLILAQLGPIQRTTPFPFLLGRFGKYTACSASTPAPDWTVLKSAHPTTTVTSHTAPSRRCMQPNTACNHHVACCRDRCARGNSAITLPSLAAPCQGQCWQNPNQSRQPSRPIDRNMAHRGCVPRGARRQLHRMSVTEVAHDRTEARSSAVGPEKRALAAPMWAVRLQAWPQCRCSRSRHGPAHRVGTSNIAPTWGTSNTVQFRTVSAFFSGPNSDDRTSGRPWTCPVLCESYLPDTCKAHHADRIWDSVFAGRSFEDATHRRRRRPQHYELSRTSPEPRMQGHGSTT